MVIKKFETERILFEKPSREDVFELNNCFSQFDGFEYLGMDTHTNIKDTFEMVKEMVDKQEKFEQFFYIMRLKSSNEIIGLSWINFDFDVNSCSIGIGLFEDYQGKGYSYERAVAFFELIFEEFGLKVVTIETTVGNEQAITSIRNYITELFSDHNEYIDYNSVTIDEEIYDNKVFQVRKEDYLKQTDSTILNLKRSLHM